MPSFGEINGAIGASIVTPEQALFRARNSFLSGFSQYTNRHVIACYSGFMQRQTAQSGIQDVDMNGFMESVHGMKNREKGLDLILHTPGGGIAATESIVNYLHSAFGSNIRCFVPQMAMSAGTMIACSCREIYMGRQSSLGPIDPQYRGTPCHGVVEEFETAAKEIKADPSKLEVWRLVIEQYSPTFIGECQKAIDLSEILVKKWLKDWMFSGDSNAEQRARKAIKALNNHQDTKTHDRHIPADEAERIGLNMKRLEDDHKLQDLVLSIHHAYMLTFVNTKVIKLIESDQGKNFVVNG
jgi:hypothetical protein